MSRAPMAGWRSPPTSRQANHPAEENAGWSASESGYAAGMVSEPIPDLFDKIVNLSKRRGIVFPSAEIYGGFRSTYDYGPVGVLILRDGECVQGPGVFLKGFLVNLLTAAGLATILYLGQDRLTSLGMRLGYVCTLALMLEGGIHLLNSNWWGIPWRNAFTGIFDAVSGAAIATIAMHFVL